MNPDELALLCQDKLPAALRQTLLAALAQGARLGDLPEPVGGGEALQALREELAPGRRRARWEGLARDLAEERLWLWRPGGPDYPPQLQAMTRPPDPLFCRGRRELARCEGVAVVGTRLPDEAGLRWTARAARALAGHGFAVISGGAAGIDAQAHRAAGPPRTVAVLGAGFDWPYPREHGGLFDRIAREGLLVSEWPPWTRPDTWRFPRRNRVIAGLSRAVVVVQAPARSGALSTAHHAAEEGREVLVCPGDPENPLYEGSHRLIREGARLVGGPEDLLEDLAGLPLLFPAALRLPVIADPPPRPSAATGRPDGMTTPVAGLWQALERPRSRDELCALLGLDPGELAGLLLEGELGGALRSLPGDRWERCR